MKEREALKLALDALKNNKQTHYYCEDTWYSCPKHEDGCANDLVGDECNCGADKANAEIDQAITAIEEALAQTEQEPVAVYVGETWCGSVVCLYEDLPLKTPLYTTPPQRTWVGLTDEEFQMIYDMGRTPAGMMEMVEAKLKEKNTK